MPRHDTAQDEIMDCTFKPDLTKKAQRKHRDVEDLMLYGEIKKQRMKQRRQFIQDLQDRELTFNRPSTEGRHRWSPKWRARAGCAPPAGDAGTQGQTRTRATGGYFRAEDQQAE